jgi:hypothetical protein
MSKPPTSEKNFLDRMGQLVPMPERPFEGFQRRRERKERNRRARAGAVGLAIALVGAIVASSVIRSETQTAREPFKQAEGWIAYASGIELVAVDPADPGRRVVLGRTYGGEFLSSGTDADPIAWSSDGTRLLLRTSFSAFEGRNRGLFVYNADGTWVTLVNEFDQRAPLPTWGSFSPSGDQVVFATDGAASGPFIVDSDGGRPHSILGPCDPPRACGEPLDEAAAWSPLGTIAWSDFVEDSGAFGHHATVLSFVDPDGTNLREEVAELPSLGLSLAWSPDGSRLLFWGNPGGVERESNAERETDIYVIDADGSGLRRITDGGENRWPAWSPDGTRIAFVRDGTLFTMAEDGSDLTELRGIRPDGPIAWNPIG